MSFPSFFTKNKILVFIILIVGACVYLNALGNNFVWDDEEMVVNNFPSFTLGNLPSLFTQATFYSGGSALSGWFYRPLVMVLFLLVKVFLGTSPFGYHVIQILLHVGNGILIFWIFNYLFNKDGKIINLVLFLMSLIYVVHPGFVEAVGYIASLAEPLYTFLLLSFFVFVLKSGEKRLKVWEILLSFLLLTLAFLTKEGALAFVPIVFVYLYLFRKKNFGRWLEIIFGSLLFYLFIRLAFFGIPKSAPNFLSPLANAPFVNKLLTLPFIIFSFFRTFFAPFILSVSQHEVVRNPNWSNFGLPILVILAFTLVALVYLIKTKSKLGLFFIVWFALGIIPVTSVLFPLDMTFAERWLYFPAIGLLGFLGTLVLSIPNLRKIMIGVLGIGVVVVFLLGVRTIARNRDWRDGYTLYAHDIVNEPESFDLQNNLGVELVRKGKWDEALGYIQKSVDLQPKWEISTNNLGAVYEHLGDNKKAEEFYRKSIELGDYYLAYENYALILVKEKKFDEAKKFLETKALVRFPNNERLLGIYSYIKQF